MPNYAINPTADQALRPNQSVVPQRVIAALALMTRVPSDVNSILGKGIEIPEYGVVVPWLVSRSELFELIPRSSFSISEGGNWPCLEFTLCGFKGLFGFNFVSDPSARLTEVQYRNFRPRNLRRTFRKARDSLTSALGRPNLVDHPRGQQTWRDDPIWIESFVVRQMEVSGTQPRYCHFLSVRFNPKLMLVKRVQGEELLMTEKQIELARS